MSNKLKKLTEAKNQIAFDRYYNRLKELALSRFEWKGLPDSVNASFLEEQLYEKGKILYFEDDVMGGLTLPCDIVGGLNVYGIATDRQVHALNGYSVMRNDKNSVMIYNNYNKVGCVPDITYFAQRLAEIDRMIDVNLNRCKTPWAIACDEKQIPAIQRLFDDIDSNKPIVVGDKALTDEEKMRVLAMPTQYLAQQLYDLKMSIWNEALTYLGIANSTIEKRERVNAQEVLANNAGTVAMRYPGLEMRKRAAEAINKMFGTNIEVEFRDNSTAELDAENDDREEDDNEIA